MAAEKNYKVYKHIFPNGKVYIGITRMKVSDRWKRGKCYIPQPLMFRAICKYGWENIKHEILYDGLTKEEACKKEIELIAYYKSNQKEFGYNISPGGFTHCEESKKKMCKSKENCTPWNKGKRTGKLSEAHREKIRLEHLGKYTGASNPMAKAVINLDTNEKFNCIKDAADKYNLHSTHICACCKGKLKTCGGYKWAYIGGENNSTRDAV